MPEISRANRHDFDGKVQHILHHAARVFSEKGYEGASIRDISRSSGVSLAGLYYYCKSKQRLLYLIQLYTFSSILSRLERRLAGVADPVERLRILVHNHLEYFLEHPVEMKVLAHEDEVLDGAYGKQVAGIKRKYYQAAVGIFEELRQAGRAGRVNPRVAVLSLFGMMNWVYTWHNPRVDLGAQALAQTIAGIFLTGVTNGSAAGATHSLGAAQSRGRMARREVRRYGFKNRLEQVSEKTGISL